MRRQRQRRLGERHGRHRRPHPGRRPHLGGRGHSASGRPLGRHLLGGFPRRRQRHGDYKKEGDAIDNAAVTSDGGATWALVGGLSGFRSAVAYVPGAPRSLIAVGPSGADLSKDDGRSWTAIESLDFHAFSFARRGAAGWAVGDNGRIARLDRLSP